MDNKKNSKSDPQVKLEEARARFKESLKRVGDNLSKENTLILSLVAGIAIGLLLYSLRWIFSKLARMGFFYYLLKQVGKWVWKNIQKEFKRDQPVKDWSSKKDYPGNKNPPPKESKE
ncbi:hypothetical protein [Candidatus Methylacidiphilum infernorum]|nr:hypothetical protein [Candidatus Methylacidiphilum infernorum]